MSGKSKIEKQEFVKLYVPELMQIMSGGDEKSCLMMAQFEYWFQRYPNGFYKFMTPAKNEDSGYKQGDSWIEEMGMSKDKIDNALKPICTHYKTFTEYKNEDDKFKSKYYASYYHKPSHKTYYLRNHDLTNEALARLALEKKSSIFKEKHSSKVGKADYSFSGNRESEFQGNVENTSAESEDGEVVYTENNPKNTTYITQRELSAPSVTEIVTLETQEVDGIYEASEVLDYSDNFQADVTSIERKSSDYPNRDVKTPFPANFVLTDGMIEWANEKNPGIDVVHATEKFKIFNRDKINSNWMTAWQMWIMREEVGKRSSLDQSAAYAKLFVMSDDVEDEQSKQVKLPSQKFEMLKRRSTEFNPKSIEDGMAEEIFKLSYSVQPYLIHRDVFHTILEGYFTTDEIDGRLKWLCDNKLFASYLDDYFTNYKECELNKSWHNNTAREQDKIKREFLASCTETSQRVIDFVTEKILVDWSQLRSEFSFLSSGKLQVLTWELIKEEKLLHLKNHFYNKILYSSDSDYKNKVDAKLDELKLLEE